ncbi:hypothetical protein [Streptomyces olivaceiscleroticus]|uniref:Uncharacterized protein n=1 Tax=Streptomyces olivaceiscleroticus TaxID=68245 RepID=A0ABN1BN18_9ACTN
MATVASAPRPATEQPSEGALAEQRHAYLDLDTDSAHTITGAHCLVYKAPGTPEPDTA